MKRILYPAQELPERANIAALKVASSRFRIEEFIGEFPDKEVWTLLMDDLNRFYPYNGDRALALVAYAVATGSEAEFEDYAGKA
jgi:hypothetical protein